MRALIRSRYWEAALRLQQMRWAVAIYVLRCVRQLLGMPRKRTNFHGMWAFRHKDKHGNLLWAGLSHNMLHDEGEKFILDVCFTEEDAVPANYYLGLDARVSLAEANALTDLVSEPSGSGYARIAVASDNVDITNSQDSGDWQSKTKTVTFTASGGSIGAVTKAFWTDVETGTAGLLISSVALSQSRTLADGESLELDMTIKLSE